MLKSKDYKRNPANAVNLIGFIMTQPKTVYNKLRGETRLYFVLACAKPTKFAIGAGNVRHDTFLAMVEQRPDPVFIRSIKDKFNKDDLVEVVGFLTNEFIAKPPYKSEQLDNRHAVRALNFFQTRVMVKGIKRLNKTEQQLINEKRFRKQFEYQLRGYNLKFEEDAFDKDEFDIDLGEIDKLIN